MGIDFLKRRNDRYRRERDERLKDWGPDLWSGCAPETIVSLCGTVVPGTSVCLNDELWAPDVAQSGPIRLFHGDIAAVDLEGNAAEHLRSERCGTAIVAQVVQVVDGAGLAVIRVAPVGRPK